MIDNDLMKLRELSFKLAWGWIRKEPFVEFLDTLLAKYSGDRAVLNKIEEQGKNVIMILKGDNEKKLREHDYTYWSSIKNKVR